MNEERQINSMIDFIEREAQEKVEELHQLAQEEYDTEKMRLMEVEKGKVRAEAEKKWKGIEIQRRVQHANMVKDQRVRIMEERAKILENLREKTRAKVASLVQDSGKYKPLMRDLLRQSVEAIRSDAKVHCRKADEGLLKGMLDEASKEFLKSSGLSCKLSISNEFLDDNESWGGIIIKSTDGRIICNNTLAYRMDHAFAEQMPTVRYLLFDPAPQK